MKLEIDDLVFGYDTRPVLDGIDLDVGTGEMLALVGPNGSGKSTLLKCTNRILHPDGGTVRIDDDDVHEMRLQQIAKRIGYVPQSESTRFPSSVFDTILMGRKPHITTWNPTDEDLDIVIDVINLLGIEDFAMRSVTEISGGQRQKVIIGRTLAQEADVLLLDEPTSDLDLKHQLEVMDLLRERVTTRNISTITAIHDLNLAAMYSDRVAMLKDGEVYTVGTPEEVFTSENIQAVFEVPVRIEQYDGQRVIIPLRRTSDLTEPELLDVADMGVPADQSTETSEASTTDTEAEQ